MSGKQSVTYGLDFSAGPRGKRQIKALSSPQAPAEAAQLSIPRIRTADGARDTV